MFVAPVVVGLVNATVAAQLTLAGSTSGRRRRSATPIKAARGRVRFGCRWLAERPLSVRPAFALQASRPNIAVATACSASLAIAPVLTGKQVVVVGLARSGVAAALLARSRGADVKAVDIRESIDNAVRQTLESAGVELELGVHKRETFTSASMVVVSPGVPRAQPDVTAAIEAGVTVVGELAFAMSFLEHLPVAAITGTNGKSTVTWFLGQILDHAGRKPFVGGNIGNPLSKAVRDLDADPEKYDCLVVEVSSYQMELPGRFRPHVGVILNLTPDHLGRHGTMENYAAHKVRMFSQCKAGDIALLPDHDALLSSIADQPGALGDAVRGILGPFSSSGLKGSTIGSTGKTSMQVSRTGLEVHIKLPGTVQPVNLSLQKASSKLLGEHNLDNAATAAALAICLGISPDRAEDAFAILEPLPHRLQVVGMDAVQGIVFVNDSKATNVESTIVGIAGIGTKQKAIVLLGGRAKDGPSSQFDPLLPSLELYASGVVCFGEARDVIADRLLERGLSVALRRSQSLADAVKEAAALASPGEAVLLSPACASFDEFDDFEHRGRFFEEVVNSIVSQV